MLTFLCTPHVVFYYIYVTLCEKVTGCSNIIIKTSYISKGKVILDKLLVTVTVH